MSLQEEFQGIVTTYDESRGFGFIRSEAFPVDVFVHASAIEGRGPLRVGQRVRFSAEMTDRGPRASQVQPGRRGLAPGATLGLLVLAASVALLIAWRAIGLPWFWAWLGTINPITLAIYALDKQRSSRSQGRRVPEAVLQGLAALGGTPAAILGVLALRHKRRKWSFIAILLAIAALQAVLLLYLIPA